MKIRPILFVVPITVAAFAFGWISRPDSAQIPSELPQIVTSSPEPDFFPVSLNDQGNDDFKLMGEALFDSHHARAVHIFDTLPGNGFARILPTIHHDLNGRDRPSIFSEFDFTFIGDDDASRNFVTDEGAMIFSLTRPKNGNDSAVNTEAAPIAEGEKLALAEFNKDPEKPRVFHIDGDSLIAYGPLRAAKSCAKCHGVDEGTILGMFRYQFDLPANLNRLNLAAVFAAE